MGNSKKTIKKSASCGEILFSDFPCTINSGFENSSENFTSNESFYFSPKSLLVTVQLQKKKRFFTVSITGEVCDNLRDAVVKSLQVEENRTSAFFKCLSRTIEYFRVVLPKKDYIILGSLLADYNLFPLFEVGYMVSGKRVKPFCPPKKVVPVFGVSTGKVKLRQVMGKDILLQERLERIGAHAHLKTISHCSTASIRLRNSDTGEIAAYNMPCRKPSCTYCGHLINEDDNIDAVDRSQNISERAKNHYRYVQIGGEVAFYSHFVFTLPKSVEGLIDRADIKALRDRDEIELEIEEIQKHVKKLKEELQRLCKDSDISVRENKIEKSLQELKKRFKVIQDRLDELDKYGATKVYGTKHKREIEELEEKRGQYKYSSKDDETIRKRIQRKKNRYGNVLKCEEKLRGLTEESRRVRKEKSRGYKQRAKDIAAKKKKLRAEIVKVRKKMERGRIPLSQMQKVCADFLQKVMGVDAALVTPHLTGERSAREGELHIHFHVMVPLLHKDMKRFAKWEKNESCPWSVAKGQPFIKSRWMGEKARKGKKGKVGRLAKEWKSFLQNTLNVEISEKSVANPEYKYLVGSSEDGVVKLAFKVRYDHRIEAGGVDFAILAPDEELVKVLRMTTRQRYTRGYGKYSDRNVEAYREEEMGGENLKDVLVKKGDITVIDGKWEVLTEEWIAEDFPFNESVKRERSKKKDGFREMVSTAMANLPVVEQTEGGEKKTTPAFVKFTDQAQKDEFEFTDEGVIFYHDDYEVYSIWQEDSNGQYILRNVLGVLPKTNKQATSGFYIWTPEVEEIAEDVLDGVSGIVGAEMAKIEVQTEFFCSLK